MLIAMFIRTLPHLISRVVTKHSLKRFSIQIKMSEKGAEVLVELRSDTFTKPNKAMLEAMVNAEVGDSSYDEDPTTKELERKCAELFGKEAGLFIPSGTMSNLIAGQLLSSS